MKTRAVLAAIFSVFAFQGDEEKAVWTVLNRASRNEQVGN